MSTDELFTKRGREARESDQKVEEDEDDFGPGFGPSAPTEEAGDGLTAEERKRQKRIRLLKQKKEENAEAYRILESRLPCAAMYEKSYMHRTELSHIAVTKTDFVITASTDGVVKFWKKTSPGIEFVKTYRAHMGPLTGLSVSFSGDVAVTSGSGEDKTLRLFDVETYDMTQMIDLPYTPSAVCVVDLETDDSDAVPVKRLGYVIAVAEANTGKVHLYHVPTMSRLGVVKPFATKQLHAENAYIHIIRYHPKRRFCLSADTAGNIEAWSLHEAREAISDFSAAYSAVEKPKPSDSAIRVAESIVEDIIAESMPSADSSAATSASGELHPEVLGDPKGVSFDMKLDTDLFEFRKCKSYPMSLEFSPDGEFFSCIGRDGYVRIFRSHTCKLYKKYDDSIKCLSEQVRIPDSPYYLDSIDAGRRIAVERDYERVSAGSVHVAAPNAVFDASGKYVMYSTFLGIKCVNTETNELVRLMGKVESSERFLTLALFQGTPVASGSSALATLAAGATQAASSSRGKEIEDPTLFALSFRRQQFFLFTRREPIEENRDVINEKPMKDSKLGTQITPGSTTAFALGKNKATIHTTMGDIQVELYLKDAPKACENFLTHAERGYYSGCIFHRVIKSFMIQGGDPTRTGAGGTSIWGRPFEDECVPHLKHDRPGVLSMANAGPNTNGSQFFLTTVPTPHLDGKHTIFGKVVGGMDVVHQIERVKTDKRDRPVSDVKIVSISIVDS